MHKRIEQLVIQTDAWCDQNLPHNWTDRVDEYLPVWNSKFAELIVRDISQMIEGQDVDPAFKHRMSWAVKDYYGVE